MTSWEKMVRSTGSSTLSGLVTKPDSLITSAADGHNGQARGLSCPDKVEVVQVLHVVDTSLVQRCTDNVEN
jgi:hypothetical protein